VKGLLTKFEQCRAILQAASWIVPRRHRRDWLNEWEAELANAWQDAVPFPPPKGLRRRCCGAFFDACWWRFNHQEMSRAREQWPRSAAFLLLGLSAALLLLVAGSGYLPRMQSILMTPPYPDPQRMITISRTGVIDSADWVVPYSWVGVWKKQAHILEGVAAYTAAPQLVWLEVEKRRVKISSVQVESSLPDVFGVKPLLGGVPPGDELCENCVMLSYQTWQREFSGDPEILQKSAKVDGKDAVIVGVLPRKFWFPSDDVGVLRLADRGGFAANQPVGVVARVRPHIREAWLEWELGLSIENATGENSFGSAIQVWPVQDRVRQPLISYGLAVCLSLALMTAVIGTGRFNLVPQRRGVGAASRWWAFFAAKTTLLIALLLAVVVEVTPEPYVFPLGRGTLLLESASLWIFSSGCLLVLWWSLLDQQRRCRVCLQRLALPAHIGSTGRLLLSWAGTELVCGEGHGLLHVSETDVCWLDPAQWTQLDDSWQPLFAEKMESEFAAD
jgi:hypothetical protein